MAEGGRQMLRHMPSRQTLARCIAPLVTAGVIAGLVGPAASPASASARSARSAHRPDPICAQRGHHAVTSTRGKQYVMKNDNYGGRSECITHHRHQVGFTVTRSAANSHGLEAMAYPMVLFGCSWGTCSKHSGLPAPVSGVHRATASWSFTGRAPGRWAAAIDVWFGKNRSALRHQAQGAELMIWLNAGKFPPRHSAIIRVSHHRWYVHHWVTRIGHTQWNYVQIRAVRPVSSVHKLAIMPIVKRVERMGLVRPHWWMLNIESGFEIWHGGRGLASHSFAASVRHRH
jgi:hypothetical protein